MQLLKKHQKNWHSNGENPILQSIHEAVEDLLNLFLVLNTRQPVKVSTNFTLQSQNLNSMANKPYKNT